MTTSTHSHKAWTDEGGHVSFSGQTPSLTSEAVACRIGVTPWLPINLICLRGQIAR